MHERKNRSGPLGKFGVRHYSTVSFSLGAQQLRLPARRTWRLASVGVGLEPEPSSIDCQVIRAACRWVDSRRPTLLESGGMMTRSVGPPRRCARVGHSGYLTARWEERGRDRRRRTTTKSRSSGGPERSCAGGLRRPQRATSHRSKGPPARR
jgi:hypothetical protein